MGGQIAVVRRPQELAEHGSPQVHIVGAVRRREPAALVVVLPGQKLRHHRDERDAQRKEAAAHQLSSPSPPRHTVRRPLGAGPRDLHDEDEAEPDVGGARQSSQPEKDAQPDEALPAMLADCLDPIGQEYGAHTGAQRVAVVGALDRVVAQVATKEDRDRRQWRRPGISE